MARAPPAYTRTGVSVEAISAPALLARTRVETSLVETSTALTCAGARRPDLRARVKELEHSSALLREQILTLQRLQARVHCALHLCAGGGQSRRGAQAASDAELKAACARASAAEGDAVALRARVRELEAMRSEPITRSASGVFSPSRGPSR